MTYFADYVHLLNNYQMKNLYLSNFANRMPNSCSKLLYKPFQIIHSPVWFLEILKI